MNEEQKQRKETITDLHHQAEVAHLAIHREISEDSPDWPIC